MVWVLLNPWTVPPGQAAATAHHTEADPENEPRTSWVVLALALAAQILVVLDISVPRGDLPAFDGPPEPADTPEWGSAVADQPDDAPVAGPNRLEPTP